MASIHDRMLRAQSPNPEHLRLLHAGEIYAGRDPMPLLEALVHLNAGGAMHRLQVLGRCDESPLPAVLRQRGWTDLVQMEGQRSYDETLDAMNRADILVLFDSPGRRIGVPAKLYEYLGTGRPILALAEPDGDTAAICASGILHRIAPHAMRRPLQRQFARSLRLLMCRRAACTTGRCSSSARRPDAIPGKSARRLDRRAKSARAAIDLGIAEAPR